MQHEREAFNVGAFTNAALANALSFLWTVIFKSQSRNCYGIQPYEYLT